MFIHSKASLWIFEAPLVSLRMYWALCTNQHPILPMFHPSAFRFSGFALGSPLSRLARFRLQVSCFLASVSCFLASGFMLGGVDGHDAAGSSGIVSLMIQRLSCRRLCQ